LIPAHSTCDIVVVHHAIRLSPHVAPSIKPIVIRPGTMPGSEWRQEYILASSIMNYTMGLYPGSQYNTSPSEYNGIAYERTRQIQPVFYLS
jgi:hypothetical protein